MSPPYRKPPADPNAPPRVGGYVSFRKAGGRTKRALIRFIYANGDMRVRPDTGRETFITPADIERAHKGAA